MNLEIAITVLLVYIAIGFVTSNLGPLATKRKVLVTSSLPSPQAASQSHTLLFFGTVLLWPVILVHHYFQSHPDLNTIGATDSTAHSNGLTYAQMKGVGTLTCGDCEKNYEALSYTQGDGWSRGYQCQTCGNFEIRSYKEPFIKPSSIYHNPQTPLADLRPIYRQHRIDHIQSMIRIIQNGMQTTSRNDWMKTWEPNLAHYREELSQVTETELAQVKKLREDADAAFKASLFCECGGTLDREQALFCPACKSKNLSYTLQHIT